jgi:2-polyprenyl-6-methoxyphenol hydroxylase-like FAD-dependent oxidoreductase/ketosteroid isomerase-like protein
MKIRGGHAVVLGASMGGLLAARVLAEFYERVTLVERDTLPTGPENRRGVPQGRLIHAIQARGVAVLEELFPGFVDQLTSMGVESWHDGDLSKLHIAIGGHSMARSGFAPDAPLVLFPSRPLLEWSVRQRVKAIPNVTFLEGHDVLGLMTTPDLARVTGARIAGRAEDHETTLTADLVVDATGRGSRMPVFLEQLGYGRPDEDELVVQLAYACQLLRGSSNTVREHLIALFPQPGRPKMFGAIRYENDTWMLAVGTMAGAEPPSRFADMLDYAADFAPANVLDAARNAEPVGGVVHHRVPSSRWRRYDKMRRLPDGLLVVGDAVCSFNPIYGQGMTVAGIEAMVLRDCLRRGGDVVPKRFFRATAKKVRVAWQTAVGSDLALPEVAGPRPISMRISNAFVERVSTASEVDLVVAGQFMRVTTMVDPPSRLLRPSILLRVMRAQRRRPAPLPPEPVRHRREEDEQRGTQLSNQNIELTRRGYEAFDAGDLEAALSLFDDSAEWTVNGESAIGGTYRGKTELAELFMRLAEKSTQVETKQFLADGNFVMVMTEVTAGGETAPEADVFEIRDGKVIRAHSFGDTAVQERVFGSKRVSAG